MKLIFLRHGQAEHQLPGWQGQTAPAKLTPAGQKAADQAGRELARFDFTAIYASPFERTRQTAAAVARAQSRPVKIRLDSRLADVAVRHHPGQHFRRWQFFWRLKLGLRPKRHRDLFDRQRLPGGRRLAETAAPAGEFLAMLRQEHRSGPVLVVGHLHTFWMLSHQLRDEPLAASLGRDHFVPPAGWREFEL